MAQLLDYLPNLLKGPEPWTFAGYGLHKFIELAHTSSETTIFSRSITFGSGWWFLLFVAIQVKGIYSR